MKITKICYDTDSVTLGHAPMQTHKRTNMPARQTTPQDIAVVSKYLCAYAFMSVCHKCTAIRNLADAHVKYVVYDIQYKQQEWQQFANAHIFINFFFFFNFLISLIFHYSLYLLLSYCWCIYFYVDICVVAFVFPIIVFIFCLSWSVANLISSTACSTLQIVKNVESVESKPK